MKIEPWLTLITGLVIGISAAGAQAFFGIESPEAYAICGTCHPAIIVKWLMNNFWGTNFTIIEAFVSFPSFLYVGVLIGSYASAHRHNKLAWRPTTVRSKYMAVLFGSLVANFGLMAGACPIRTGLLVAYGSVAAVILLASIIMGVILALGVMSASIYLRHGKEPAK